MKTKYTFEEAEEKLKERGYTIIYTNGTRTRLGAVKDKIAVAVDVDKDEFEIKADIVNTLLITTRTCGSFMNDTHFNKLERSMRLAVINLEYCDLHFINKFDLEKEYFFAYEKFKSMYNEAMPIEDVRWPVSCDGKLVTLEDENKGTIQRGTKTIPVIPAWCTEMK
ncbi:hypothetical protein D3C81_07910 [compost metagenome]